MAQSNDDIIDLTNVLEKKTGGWSIGNACGEDFFLHGVIKTDLDMKGDDIEILNSHVVIEGEALNMGKIIYLCDNSILEVLGGVLGIPDLQEKETLKVFPNPANNEINVIGVEVKELELYDLTGRRLKHYTTFGQCHRIMVDDLKGGVYILKINGSITRKIIKL